MFEKLKILFILSLSISGLFAQNNALILNGAAYVILNGGTSSTPVRLIVNQSNASGISRPVANNGWIVSEGEFNYVQWNIATSTGNYVIPYNYSSTDMPFSMNITGAGVGGNSVLFSTYHTAASDNLPIATYNGTTTIPNINNVSGANNSAKMLDRWWIIDATSGYTTKPAATMTFSYVDIEHSVATNSISEANLQAQSYNTSTSNWVISDLFGTDVPASNYVNNAVIPAAKLFRSWVLVDKTSPLPIELLSFNAFCKNEFVTLNWKTATEINNNFFTIEKTKDFYLWEFVTNIDGARNSNSTIFYTTYDLSPYKETSYYRLKQTDYNGESKYFSIISVICNDNYISTEDNLYIYQDKTKNEIIVNFKSFSDETAILSLCNTLGQVLVRKKIQLNQVEQLNINNIPIGVYFVSIINKINILTKKIIIE